MVGDLDCAVVEVLSLICSKVSLDDCDDDVVGCFSVAAVSIWSPILKGVDVVANFEEVAVFIELLCCKVGGGTCLVGLLLFEPSE